MRWSACFSRCGPSTTALCGGISLRVASRLPLQTPRNSVNVFGFFLEVIHEEILAEGVWRGEVGFAAAKLGDFLDEVNEAVVAGEHEGVDEDAGAAALGNFFECLSDDEGIEAEGVFVDTAVFEGERGRLSVGNHDDLAHVFFLAVQDA